MGIPMRVHSISKANLRQHVSISFAGASCEVSTNSQALVSFLYASSGATGEACRCAFTMHVLVNEESEDKVEVPHFRGLNHVVVASFGSANMFVYDLLRRHVSAKVSAALARDGQFWSRKILPITIGVLGAAVGTMPMHCACLSSQGEGLLIAGGSGAGKSTLSVALSQAGLEYVADDWTYLSDDNARLVAHGTSAPVKLLPDAVQHFKFLSEHGLGTSMNGELAYEVDPCSIFSVSAARACEPRWLVFLERIARPGSEFVPLSAARTRSYLESSVERLPVQLTKAVENRAGLIDRIAELPCWSFRYGGTPQFAAEILRKFVASQKQQEVCV